MSASNSAATNSRENPTVQEYTVRVPKNPKKKLSVMRFHTALGVDFAQWSQVKMERENNMAQFKTFVEEERPKFGAGSEFGREQREEARRRKYTSTKKYRPEDQPWLLNIGGKTGKKYRGVREGGVAENASYYVFTQAPDGAFEAFPVEEWYNFQHVQKYKALSAEEAEEEFSRRNRTLNLFSLMVRKRLKNEDGVEAEGEEGVATTGKKKKSGEGRLSDMDDLMESSGGDSSGEEEKEEEDEDASGKKGKGKKGKAAQKKKKKRGSDDEGGEDSDDGDGEGREIDYISSSESESDLEEKANNGLKGVVEEDGLRKLLNSDEEDEEEEEENKEEEEENEEEEQKDEQATASTSKEGKDEKKKKNKKDKKSSRKEDYGSSSDTGADSSDAELEKSAAKQPAKVKGSAESSRSTTPTKAVATKAVASALAAAAAAENGEGKSKAGGSDASPPAKRQKLESSASGTEAMIEEAVRRYLVRKPMTTTELLQKFKSKRTGLSSDQMVQLIAQILKRINLNKQMVKGKMYLSIKADGAK